MGERRELTRGNPVYIRGRARRARKNRATLSRSFEPAKRARAHQFSTGAILPRRASPPLRRLTFASPFLFLSPVSRRRWDGTIFHRSLFTAVTSRSTLRFVVSRSSPEVALCMRGHRLIKTRSSNCASFASANLPVFARTPE